MKITSWKLLLALLAGAMLFTNCGGGGGGFEYNGLHWQVGPDRDMTWFEAKEWVEGLGSDWRMPTREELQSLRNAGVSAENWGPFENSGWFVWSGELHDSSSAWGFYFNIGIEDWDYCRYKNDHERAFAVRSR